MTLVAIMLVPFAVNQAHLLAVKILGEISAYRQLRGRL